MTTVAEVPGSVAFTPGVDLALLGAPESQQTNTVNPPVEGFQGIHDAFVWLNELATSSRPPLEVAKDFVAFAEDPSIWVGPDPNAEFVGVVIAKEDTGISEKTISLRPVAEARVESHANVVVDPPVAEVNHQEKLGDEVASDESKEDSAGWLLAEWFRKEKESASFDDEAHAKAVGNERSIPAGQKAIVDEIQDVNKGRGLLTKLRESKAARRIGTAAKWLGITAMSVTIGAELGATGTIALSRSGYDALHKNNSLQHLIPPEIAFSLGLSSFVGFAALIGVLQYRTAGKHRASNKTC